MTVEPADVRLAGSGRLADGALVTWTVAEGRRGRRWREAIVRDDALVHSLLYETDAGRRFSHLELATPTGLVTLHPEGDGTLHGNVVRGERGIEHVVGMPFADGAILLVRGSVVASAAVAWARQGSGGDGLPGVVLDPVTLRLWSETVDLGSLGPIDDLGIPALDGARIWPLEDAVSG